MDAPEDDPLFVEEGKGEHTPAVEKNYVYAIGSRTILRGMLLVIFPETGFMSESILCWGGKPSARL